MEIQCRREVGHVAHGVDLHALIVLHELRHLRLHHHAHVEVELRFHHAEHHFQVVGVGLVLRIAAQRLFVVAVERIGEGVEIVVPRAVFRREGIEIVLAKIGEVVSRPLALVVAIFETIDKLQEGVLPQRLRIGQLHRVVPVLRRGEVVAVGLISGVLPQHVTQEEEMYIVGREGCILRICIAGLGDEGDVASRLAELAVDLQAASHRFRLAVAHAHLLAHVHHERILIEQGNALV